MPRVLRYLLPYRMLAASSVIVTILDAFASLLTPWPLKFLFDSVLGSEPLPPILATLLGPLADDRVALLVVFSAAGLAMALLDNGLSVLGSYLRTTLERWMALDFRSDLFQHAQRLSLSFHDQRRSGMLIYAINHQADSAASLPMTLLPLAQSLLTLVGMLWISFQIHPQMALLSLSVVPVISYAVRYYVTHVEQRLRDVKGMEGESLSIIHEAMSMLRVIVAFGREDHEHRRFRDQGERAADARVQLTLRQTLFSMAVNLTTATGTALVLGFGVYLALQGELTGGELLVMLSYMAAVYKPLESISYAVSSIQDHLISVQIAFDLLDIEPEIKDSPRATPIGRARGRVTFEGVEFSYSGRVDTLKDISFKAEAGQVVAIVGPTGAGKTTLISLLPRFYDPRGGQILLDGTDIRELTLRSLRQQISIVPQEPLLFSGTIADNIRYGRLGASMDEIIESATTANAHDFIMRLPNQYQTELGERGAKLSGGERQRISVARAFLKDAPILILDEPTSSIDSRTEAVILDALDRLMVGRTTFMIAHRLSTVRHADLILVLDHGRLVDQGSHDELLRRGGLYKELHDVQTNQARRRGRPALTGLLATGVEGVA